MSAQRAHFDAPPLVEAVFDCFVKSGELMSVSAVESAFFSRFPEYSASTTEEWHQFSSSIEIRSGKPQSSSVDTELAGVRRWNAERNRAVLVGPEVLALNIKPPYGHFEDHQPHLRELVKAFLEVIGPERILWLGHRYINQIVLQLEEATDPGELLTLYPRLTRGRALSHPPVAVQLEAGRFEGGSVLTSLSLGAKTAQKAIYSLDVYARTSEQVALDPARVVDWHTLAHGAIIDAFLESITAQARVRFRERIP